MLAFGASLLLGLAQVAIISCEVDVSQRHVAKCTFGQNSSISLNIHPDSRCCSAVEVYLARRKGGYCPTFASQLSFGVKCEKSLEFDGKRMPDEATVRAAAHEICGLKGCAAAIHEVYQNRLIDETFVPKEPNCHTVGNKDGHTYVLSAKKAGIAGTMFLATLLLIVIGHQKLTPKWIANSMARARAAAHAAKLKRSASPTTASCGNKAQSIARAASMASSVKPCTPADLAVTQDDDAIVEHAEPVSPEVIDRPESPELIDVLVEDDVIITCPDAVSTPCATDKVLCSPLSPSSRVPATPSDSMVDLDVLSMQPQPESKSADPIAVLLTARSRCKAHFGLFRCLSIIFTIARLGFAVPYASTGDHFFLVLAISCVYQCLIVIQQGTPDFSQEHPMHGCCVAIRDLRGFAYSTVVLEAFVLFSVAVGAVVEGDFFLLQQASLDLVLVRLYVAWLALGLRRHVIALTFAVVPEEEEPREPGCQGKDFDQPEPAMVVPRSAFDALVPAWPAPEQDFVAPTKGFRKLKLWWRVCLLVMPTLLVVSAVGIWIVMSKETQKEELSSCRTAMRGVDFCVPTDFLGQPIDMKTIDECCKSCDAASGCTAWTFAETDDSGAGRCWRLHFTEAPCDERPGHLSCRCHTSSDRHGGFKPKKGDIIWHSDE